MSKLTDDILSLICERREVSLIEIRENLAISQEILDSQIFLLVEYGFIRLDKTEQYVRLSARSKKYVRLE